MSRKTLSIARTTLNSLRRCTEDSEMIQTKLFSMEYRRSLSVSRVSCSAGQQLSPWVDALDEAERLVGCPASLSTLQSLFSNEMSTIAAYIKKMEGSSHPLLQIARDFVANGKAYSQPRGLLVLLVADLINQDVSEDILKKQKSLAEITEMIHTAHRIHKGVVNNHSSINHAAEGNKVAILSGDYLLANAGSKLAAFNMTKVVDLMGSSISDFAESQFMGDVDSCGDPLPDRSFGFKQWEQKTFLSSASLIAKSCESCALMTSASEKTVSDCFEYGKHLGMAWQAHLDCQAFRHVAPIDFDMASLPVVVHLSKNPEPFLSMHSKSRDLAQLRKLILESGAMEECKEICTKYTESALETLQRFPQSEAKKTLIRITSAIHDSS